MSLGRVEKGGLHKACAVSLLVLKVCLPHLGDHLSGVRAFEAFVFIHAEEATDPLPNKDSLVLGARDLLASEEHIRGVHIGRPRRRECPPMHAEVNVGVTPLRSLNAHCSKHSM
jgi:hypothetical protein